MSDHPRVPSLSKARSEFQILCDDLGGPAELCSVPAGLPCDAPHLFDLLRLACRIYSFLETWAAFREWEPNKERAMRYWPWIAFLAFDYHFERADKEGNEATTKPGDKKRKSGYGTEPSPTQVINLIERIASRAHKLRDDLVLLRELANRLEDPKTPFRRAHLSWLDEYLAQSLTFGPLSQVSEVPITSMLAEFGSRKFHRQLALLSNAAITAANKVSRDLLAQPSGPRDLGLRNLSKRGAVVWQSLTGRKASALRVRPRSENHPTHANDDAPDFALFLGAIARLAGAPEPTPEQIEKALAP